MNIKKYKYSKKETKILVYILGNGVKKRENGGEVE